MSIWQLNQKDDLTKVVIEAVSEVTGMLASQSGNQVHMVLLTAEHELIYASYDFSLTQVTHLQVLSQGPSRNFMSFLSMSDSSFMNVNMLALTPVDDDQTQSSFDLYQASFESHDD